MNKPSVCVPQVHRKCGGIIAIAYDHGADDHYAYCHKCRAAWEFAVRLPKTKVWIDFNRFKDPNLLQNTK